MYFALEHIEGQIIQGAIERLRNQYGLFSHALIHDAVLIHNAIPTQAVMSAYQSALNTIKVTVSGKTHPGQHSTLQDVILKITDWKPLIKSAEAIAHQHGYDKDKDWTVFTAKEKSAQGFANTPIYDHRDSNIATK